MLGQKNVSSCNIFKWFLLLLSPKVSKHVQTDAIFFLVPLSLVHVFTFNARAISAMRYSVDGNNCCLNRIVQSSIQNKHSFVELYWEHNNYSVFQKKSDAI